VTGGNYNVTLPDNLAPGGYLIRNEIIGLQNAMAPGGAEFFPSCTQLRIIGNDTGVPGPNDTVPIPGAYNATDPGILFDAYTDPNTPYVFPGPPIATLVNATSEMEGTTGPAFPAAQTEEKPLSSSPNSAPAYGPMPPIADSAPSDPSPPPVQMNGQPLASVPDLTPAAAAGPPVVDELPVLPILAERERHFHSRVIRPASH